MNNAAELTIKGIKCDHCDYRHEGYIPPEDYKKWLNKPCPKCGANLLTEKDYKITLALLAITRLINIFTPKRKRKGKRLKYSVEMDGTGKVEFKPAEGDDKNAT